MTYNTDILNRKLLICINILTTIRIPLAENKISPRDITYGFIINR